MPHARHAIFLTLLIAAVAGPKALAWTPLGHVRLPPDRAPARLVVLARRVALELARARQARPFCVFGLARRIGAHRLIHVVRRLLSAGFVPPRLSLLELRLPPPVRV